MGRSWHGTSQLVRFFFGILRITSLVVCCSAKSELRELERAKRKGTALRPRVGLQLLMAQDVLSEGHAALNLVSIIMGGKQICCCVALLLYCTFTVLHMLNCGLFT